MKHIFLSLILLFSLQCFTQTMFERHYGGVDNDIANSIIETSDGCYVFTGETRSKISYQQVFFTVKLDIQGDTIWTKAEEIINSKGHCIIETQDNSLIVSGQQLVNNEVWPIIIKYDGDGNTLWVKNYSEYLQDGAYHIVETQNGDFVFNALSNGDGKLIGIDNTGNYLWEKSITSKSCYSLNPTEDEGFILSGTIDVDGPYTKTWLAKINSSLDYEWQKTLGGENTRSASFDITPTMDEGYISCGSWFNGSVILYGHIYITKMDSEGNLQWEKMISGINSEDDLRGIAITEVEDGYVITGNYQEFTNYDDIYIIKLNVDGDTEWSKRVGGEYSDKTTDIISTLDGGLLVSGYTHNNTMGGADAYLLKMDNNGSLVNTISTKLKDDIQIIPNPFTNQINISSGNGINQILVRTIENKTIRNISISQNYNTNIKINLESLNSGTYIVSIFYDDKIIHKKILKI